MQLVKDLFISQRPDIFQAISDLGFVIYSALDHGLGEHEERMLNKELTDILETMIEAGSLKVNHNNKASFI